jgi:UDP-N-acetylglucosamine 2-epimerase (non-hydrolysing)
VPGICGEPRHVQIGRMVEQLDGMFAERPPAAVLVWGDTNTVCAAAQAGNYAGVSVVHIEACQRSHDRAMPERSTVASPASWPICTAPHRARRGQPPQ